MSEKKYVLFAGHRSYPDGGSADFRAFSESVDELKLLYAKYADDWSMDVSSYPDPWGEIVDHETMQSVLRIRGHEGWEMNDH